MFGLATAVVGLIGYGFAWGVLPVVVLMIIHGPEGFVHPMLTAMLTKNVPPDAQGELQGGLSAIMSVAMLLGTVVFSQIFGMSLAAGGRFATDIPFFIAGAGMAACLVMFMRIMPADAKKAQF